MNFDTSRKNYSGLAFVAVLHLVAAGIALKHSTILIPPQVIVDPIFVDPLPPESPKPKRTEEFKIPFTAPPIITPPILDPAVKPVIEPPPITTSPPDGPIGDPEPKRGSEIGAPTAPPRAPVNVAALIDAASCAKPAYPAGALRNGDEGTVTLAFLVGKDGRVASAKVERTSGHRDLDRAALQGLSLCAFKPGTIDGVAQESWARMQYAWQLDQ